MTEEITTRSWGSRLKDAIIGIFIGIGLIIGSVVLIFWNEQHSLHTAQSLAQAQKIVISVPGSPIKPENDLKVVYLNGHATTEDKLTDSQLGVTVTAINLKRKVEMYQWQEKTETKTESQLGGSEKQTKTYTYNKIWSPSLIDSANFRTSEGHQNPTAMPIQSQTQYAEKVTLGDFSLPNSLITQIDESKAIDLSKVNKESLQNELKKPVTLMNDELYVGKDAQNPETGDLRINLTAVYPQVVSIIAQQTGTTLQPYLAPAGETVMLLSTGVHSPAQMIADAQSENRMIAWILRLVTFIMLFAGFSLILSPLVVLADVIPFLGSIVNFGTGFVAFICGLCVWIVATAIAWFVTRPLLSLGLIAVAAILSYLLIKMRAKKLPPPTETMKLEK